MKLGLARDQAPQQVGRHGFRNPVETHTKKACAQQAGEPLGFLLSASIPLKIEPQWLAVRSRILRNALQCQFYVSTKRHVAPCYRRLD